MSFVSYVIGYIFVLIGAGTLAIGTDQINHPIIYGIHSAVCVAVLVFGLYFGVTLFGP